MPNLEQRAIKGKSGRKEKKRKMRLEIERILQRLKKKNIVGGIKNGRCAPSVKKK